MTFSGTSRGYSISRVVAEEILSRSAHTELIALGIGHHHAVAGELLQRSRAGSGPLFDSLGDPPPALARVALPCYPNIDVQSVVRRLGLRHLPERSAGDPELL